MLKNSFCLHENANPLVQLTSQDELVIFKSAKGSSATQGGATSYPLLPTRGNKVDMGERCQPVEISAEYLNEAFKKFAAQKRLPKFIVFFHEILNVSTHRRFKSNVI